MTNVVFVLPHGSKNNKCYTWSVLVLPHAFKNVHFMRCMLVLPRGLKNNECYMSSTLVSPHGFRNDIYFICSPLVFPHGWEIFSLSLANWSAGSPINSCQDELPPSDPMKSFGQLLQNPPPPLCSCQPLLVPLIKSLGPISGSGHNWTQSACWWTQPDSGWVYWTFA